MDNFKTCINLMNKFTAIDLFCGAGGLTTGLKQAGFQVIAGVELNPIAAETYQLNHGEHKLYNCDIKQLDPYLVMKDLSIRPGDLDLLAGCPPCQGFSTLRTRNQSSSVNDDRNDLVFDFLRFVSAMHPKTIMMENVPGLAKDPRIQAVLEELIKLGYSVNENTIQVKNASDYGVPQRRKRMILQTSRFGEIGEPTRSEKITTVYDAIGKLPKAGTSDDELHDYPENRTSKTRALIEKIPLDGGSRRDLPKEFWLPCHIKSPHSYIDVYGRMSWNNVAPTITGGCTNPSKGRFLHPSEHRAITLREAALLQSFPPDYKFSLKRGKDVASLMIGNALPPEFIKRHAISFTNHLNTIKE